MVTSKFGCILERVMRPLVQTRYLLIGSAFFTAILVMVGFGCSPKSDALLPPPTTDNSDQIVGDEQSYNEFLDISYTQIPGVSTNLTSLDIYTPQIGQNHPIIIYIHGGSWVTGDKSNVDNKPQAFTDAGYLFVSINYRLSPAVKHPSHVQDIAKAIAWVYQNATLYDGDASKLTLVGHSAGAHLAALIATNEQYLQTEGLDLNVIDSVVLLDGIGYDLLRLIESIDFTSFPIYTIPFGSDSVMWADASPIKHVSSNKGIPAFLLIYVEGSTSTQLDAQLFADKLIEAGVQATMVAASGVTHSTLNENLGLPQDDITDQVMKFILDKNNAG
ncbi:MAG: alpha/beta hydrolase [Dehalococcoidia bacterium]|nr:MAG: alpha/beta hydrolase [Dehalococcoidia bacterium]